MEEALLKADIIILGAPHSVYRGLQIPEGKQVVDVWGFWRRESLDALAARGNR
jgi:UDP-N-acetyl-D-mannosaminuronic acid dehydrogenase